MRIHSILFLSQTMALAFAEDNDGRFPRLRRRLQDEQSSILTNVRDLSSEVMSGKAAILVGTNRVSNLQRCQGDCDKDSDCAKGLKCHQRSRGEKVPGCDLDSTLFSSDYDFCVPDTSSPHPDDSGNPSSNVKASFVGNYGASALQRCQGDCDKDSDCAKGLKCHQRSRGEKVPGCDLDSTLFSSDYDFCVPDTSSPDSFALKLYWEQGYNWQEETIERKWCLSCREDCHEGDEVVIYNCEDSPTKWVFISHGPNEVQIKVADRDICIQRNPVNDLELERCNKSIQRQRFVANGGSFGDRRFEITPKQRPGMCMTQRHHPKSDEFVNVEPCTTAQRSQTSYWNKY